MTDNKLRSLTPGLPEYRLAGHFLRILDGVSYPLYRSMYNDIWEQRGNPQETVNWTEPEKWIPERLQGEEQHLALRIWRESRGELNPRYTRGCWYLCTKHDLLQQSGEDQLQITDKGWQFLERSPNSIMAEIDAYEGVLTILRMVGERGPGRRSEFLPEFTIFCQTLTN